LTSLIEDCCFEAAFHEIGRDLKSFNFQKYDSKKLQHSEDSVLILKPGYIRDDSETHFFLIRLTEKLFLYRVRHVCTLRDHACGRESCAILTFCVLRKGYKNTTNSRRTFVGFFSAKQSVFLCWCFEVELFTNQIERSKLREGSFKQKKLPRRGNLPLNCRVC